MRLRNARFPARITQDHPITTYPTPKPFFATNDNFYSIALSYLYKILNFAKSKRLNT